MLDTDADRIRVDELRAFVDARKREAEAERVDAVERRLGAAAAERTGEIDAYEELLDYLDSSSTELIRLRD